MKLKPSSYFLISIMVILVIVISVASTMEYKKAKLLPIVLGSIVFILAVIELRKELLSEDKPAELSRREKMQGRDTSQRYWSTAAWMVGFLVVVWLVGVVVATPLFVMSYLKSHGKGWVASVMVAVGTTAFVYVIFIWLLHEELHRGLLFN